MTAASFGLLGVIVGAMATAIGQFSQPRSIDRSRALIPA